MPPEQVYADIYKEVSSGSACGLSGCLKEAFAELVFVPPGDFRQLEECTWEEDGAIQWLTEVPALQAHYPRYGPGVQRYFLDVLDMPQSHPGFSPGALLTALRNLVRPWCLCKFVWGHGLEQPLGASLLMLDIVTGKICIEHRSRWFKQVRAHLAPSRVNGKLGWQCSSNLVRHVEDALDCTSASESLPQTPTTAGSLLESMASLAGTVYSSLAQACRKSSVTWHADVRRAFSQERLLVLPPQHMPDLARAERQSRRRAEPGRSHPSRDGQARVRESSNVSSLPAPDASRRHRPKRLFTKEAWWEVEDELKETKATKLRLCALYGSIQDAEFLFLRVIGVRRCASRSDVVQRLRESMSSAGPLSNWTEGIDISDLEELENIQTSSYFRPADWRVPGVGFKCVREVFGHKN